MLVPPSQSHPDVHLCTMPDTAISAVTTLLFVFMSGKRVCVEVAPQESTYLHRRVCPLRRVNVMAL